jgi:hypothetical protein
MPHTKRYKKYQLGGSDIYDLSSEFCRTTRKNIHIFLPNHLEKHPMTIRFVSRRQPQLPLLPRRILGVRGETALHWAALNGHAAVVELLISLGAKVDAADNRGPWPRKGFRVVLGEALAR